MELDLQEITRVVGTLRERGLQHEANLLEVAGIQARLYKDISIVNRAMSDKLTEAMDDIWAIVTGVELHAPTVVTALIINRIKEARKLSS